jgi:predicted DNA-binding transcriptional regulator YafY
LSPHGVRLLRFVVEAVAVPDTFAEPDADGWVRARLPVESLDVAYTYMLRLGPEVEVLAPPSLRDRMAAAAERMRGLYR